MQTFLISEVEVILDVFRFFKGRDMILEANDMADRNLYTEEKQNKMRAHSNSSSVVIYNKQVCVRCFKCMLSP